MLNWRKNCIKIFSREDFSRANTKQRRKKLWVRIQRRTNLWINDWKVFNYQAFFRPDMFQMRWSDFANRTNISRLFWKQVSLMDFCTVLIIMQFSICSKVTPELIFFCQTKTWSNQFISHEQAFRKTEESEPRYFWSSCSDGAKYKFLIGSESAMTQLASVGCQKPASIFIL